MFAAVTVNLQGVPLIRPFTVIGLAGPEAVCPELDVTVYEVIFTSTVRGRDLEADLGPGVGCFYPHDCRSIRDCGRRYAVGSI